ncbi:MAG TPA: hypothetical protein DHL02_18310 [Achromobacter sp.]|nr:hypothetical protein [Achromobacter sp.]
MTTEKPSHEAHAVQCDASGRITRRNR